MMPRFIEPLENRRLLSVSATTLAADLQAVDNASSAAYAAGTSLRDAVVADKTEIIAAVRGSETKTNRASENRLTAVLNSHDLSHHVRDAAALHALLTGGNALAAQRVKLGDSLLAHPTSKGLAHEVSVGAASLDSVVATRLNLVNTLLGESTFVADLDNVAAANPSLASTIAADESALGPLKAAYVSALSQYQGATSALASDLSALAGG